MSMLKLFRRIRRKLLDEGSISKYLVYAIGEILLVVIGILIALQINTWRQNAINNQLEIQYLSMLLDDIRFDIVQLDTVISRTTYRQEEPFSYGVDVLFGNIKNFDKEKFSAGLVRLGVIQHFTPRDNAFNELISTGNIKLINNQELKNLLHSYYNRNEYFQFLYERFADGTMFDLQYIYEEIQYSPVREDTLVKQLWHFEVEDYDINALMNNRKLRNSFLTQLTKAKFYKTTYIMLQNMCLKIEGLLEKN